MKRAISRKEFLAAATKSVAAASVVGGVGLLAAGDQRRAATVQAVPRASAVGAGVPAAIDSQSAAVSASVAPVVWPLPYARLDTEDVRKRAHKYYYDGGCGYAVFNGLLSALSDAYGGGPFAQIPPQMMYFGGGGAAGWGTLCGALNGAGLAVSLVVDRTNANKIINEIFGWYTKASFPSDASNIYAQQHAFLVNKVDASLMQTTCGSPLCHVSVSHWCRQSGFGATSAQRAERCARLSGDVAAKTVDELNAFFDGRFGEAFQSPLSVSSCGTNCHSYAPGDGRLTGNVPATVKMDCQQCHHEHWDHLY